jgi:hypothetical protein
MRSEGGIAKEGHKMRSDGGIAKEKLNNYLFGTHLDGWLVKMPKVGCCLSWFLAKHHGLWVNQTKRINHNLPFYTLNWIHNHSHSSLIQSFKTLQKTDLSISIILMRII